MRLLAGFLVVIGAGVAHAQAAPICAPPGTRSGRPASARVFEDSLWRSARPYSLVVEVVDIDGTPLEAALLRLIGPLPDSVAKIGGTTDVAGRFRFTALPHAQYVLDVQRIGFLGQRHEVDALPAGADSLCVRLRVRSFYLRPLDRNAAHGAPSSLKRARAP